MSIGPSSVGWGRLVACAVALLLSACKPTPVVAPNPEPGALTLSIQSSGAQGYAFLIEITGQASNATAVDDGHLLFQTATGSGLRLILIGAAGSGPVARIQVPDIGQAAVYTAQVVEVADDSNRLLSASGFSAQIGP